MLYSVPDYYKEFHCIADRCEDTCCAGWQIVVDKKSLKNYKKVRGDFRKRIRKGTNFRKETFHQDKEKRCAFLNENNLCDMYTALGPESLCRTCRLYPRHIEEFENVREISLSISCPEVARILMNRTKPVRWKSVEKEGDEEYDDFDPFLYSELLDAREVIRGIFKNREIPVSEREDLVYGLVREMQKKVDGNELFACGEVLENYQEYRKKAFGVGGKNARFEFAKKRFRMLHRLELLKEDWELLLLETEKLLFLDHFAEEYQQLSREFSDWIENHFPWEIQKEQLLVYFIDTYFCGAVYDGELQAKAEMALICTETIEDLLKARWLRNEKQLETEDVIELVYRFSREVEHSDLNLKKMENMMPGRRK